MVSSGSCRPRWMTNCVDAMQAGQQCGCSPAFSSIQGFQRMCLHSVVSTSPTVVQTGRFATAWYSLHGKEAGIQSKHACMHAWYGRALQGCVWNVALQPVRQALCCWHSMLWHNVQPARLDMVPTIACCVLLLQRQEPLKQPGAAVPAEREDDGCLTCPPCGDDDSTVRLSMHVTLHSVVLYSGISTSDMPGTGAAFPLCAAD